MNDDIHGVTSPKASVNAFSTQVGTHAESAPSEGRASSLYFPSSNQLPSTRLSLAMYPNEDGQHPHNEMTTSNVPKMFSVDPTSNFGPNMRNLQPGMTTSGVDIEMDMDGNEDMTLDFDPSLFDQSMLSTINWLPNEFFTSDSNEQIQTPGVPSQQPQPVASDSHATRMTWHSPVINSEQASPSMAESISYTPSRHISLGTDMGSPRRYSHVSSEASPHSGSVDSTKQSSDYYVDGGGARLPKYRKKQSPWSTSTVAAVAVSEQSISENTSRRHGFPNTHGINTDNISEVARSVPLIETSTHHELYRNFLLLCRTDNPFFEMFESDNFPSAQDCTGYLACYFDSFHDVYPIMHLPTFEPNRCHWLLVLAIVAIGCQTLVTHEAVRYRDAFHEMIRRAIYVEVSILSIHEVYLLTSPVSFDRKKSCTAMSHLSSCKQCYSIASGFFTVAVSKISYRLLACSKIL